MAFTTARTSMLRGRTPGFPSGIIESTNAHCASVKSVAYVLIPLLQNLERSLRTRLVTARLFKQPLSYSTGAILALHWGTLHRTIRAKDATIAGFGAEQRLTANAFVEELAGLSWHRFAFGEAANGTYQHGFQNKLAHTRLSLSGRPLRAVMHKPHQRTLAGIRLTVRPGRGGFSATSRSIS